ncbi:MAG: hypothetical protein B7Y88_11315 [Sphingomonadales bacterium 32-64-17]|nr:MAG: hypothetical protein B7Y88_11315 [Sphingomonadales bacterium 32-64-17]
MSTLTYPRFSNPLTVAYRKAETSNRAHIEQMQAEIAALSASIEGFVAAFLADERAGCHDRTDTFLAVSPEIEPSYQTYVGDPASVDVSFALPDAGGGNEFAGTVS